MLIEKETWQEAAQTLHYEAEVEEGLEWNQGLKRI